MINIDFETRSRCDLITAGAYNWIKCRHNATGQEQMFPGMACPNNWHPV